MCYVGWESRYKIRYYLMSLKIKELKMKESITLSILAIALLLTGSLFVTAQDKQSLLR